jgi:hypothetical protein
MKRFIFGFQRRVWWPKWTPLSSSWRIVTTGMGCLSFQQGVRATRRCHCFVDGYQRSAQVGRHSWCLFVEETHSPTTGLLRTAGEVSRTS